LGKADKSDMEYYRRGFQLQNRNPCGDNGYYKRWTSTNRYKMKKKQYNNKQQQGLPVTEDAVQKGAEAILEKNDKFNK
jgi:hypothetical protein